MRKIVAAVVVAVSLVPGRAAAASDVTFDASPNPARIGDRVIHKVHTPFAGRLKVWVSARGFKRPANGTLPPGSWSWECCPAQTMGAPAWHYRSTAPVAAGSYRFGAVGKLPGTHCRPRPCGA